MPATVRQIIAAFLLTCVPAISVARADNVAEALAAASRVAQAGAPRLALRRIDAGQPAEVAAPGWARWENLRLQLLIDTDRNEDVLQRAALWSPALPAGDRGGLHVQAARAALALGRTGVARDHAGRALWMPGAGAGALRELRLLVIRCDVSDARADDAYRSMLRFEQDYRPLDVATATLFVDALLDLGRAREAVNWLGLLDERSAVKLRLRLHTGVVTPQDAARQARAALDRSDDPAWWRVLLEAAERQNDNVLRIAAQEKLLDAKAPAILAQGAATAPDGDAERLWKTYAEHARAAANRHHLLAGDDASWLEFADRRRKAEPAEARAYLAYLAGQGRDPELRLRAQSRLAADYEAARLPRAALRVFESLSADVTVLAVPARHTLGTLAEMIGDHPRALRYWQGSPAPDNVPAAIWPLRLSALALRAGRADAARDLIQPIAAQRAPVAADQLPDWIDLAGQFDDHGLHDVAQTVFERVLPHADAALARRVLSGIARSHEARGQPLLAAEYYLRSALHVAKETPLGGAPAGDAAAAQARMLAGFSLARAGLREDARAQFEWLLKNARDPVQIAIARRELGF